MFKHYACLTLLIALSALQLVSLKSAEADEIRLAYNSQWYPYSYGEGAEVQGILVELLDQLLGARLGYDLRHSGYPWSRAQHLVAEGREHALFTYPSEQRLGYSSRSEFDVYHIQSRAFVRQGSDLEARLKSSARNTSLKGTRICVMLGDNWSENFYRQRDLEFEYGRDTHNCLEQVAYNRSDLFIHASAASLAVISQSQLNDMLTMLPEVYSSVPLTLLIGNQSPVPDDLLDRFDAEVRTMIDDGSLSTVIKDLLARPWPNSAAGN